MPRPLHGKNINRRKVLQRKPVNLNLRRPASFVPRTLQYLYREL
jgi:hypothetical protein